ncbi:MAG TPA: hypothetical protein VHO84_04280 [Syntrophorhabdaceae bacterium]|nr:hypothetical protein [Syntrophorhabdaceae bacterium]
MNRLLNDWGIVLGLLFAVLMGFIGYRWADPEYMRKILFSELALDTMLLFGIGIPIASLICFFHLPKSIDNDEETDMYAVWVRCGMWLLVGTFVLICLMMVYR